MERFSARSNLMTVNLDIFPASTPDDEIKIIRRQMAGVAEKHGKSQEELSSGLAEQYNMEGWEKPLASRAGFQVKILPFEENFDLTRDGAITFIEAYMAMVGKLKDCAYSTEDEKLMNEMRSHWLEYLLLKDGAVKMSREKGHPFDALRWMGLPPTIHY